VALIHHGVLPTRSSQELRVEIVLQRRRWGFYKKKNNKTWRIYVQSLGTDDEFPEDVCSEGEVIAPMHTS
jgi:hypothetical protein